MQGEGTKFVSQFLSGIVPNIPSPYFSDEVRSRFGKNKNTNFDEIFAVKPRKTASEKVAS